MDGMESDPQRYLIERDAIARAFKAHLDGLLTEPMPLWKLSGFFDCNRKTMAVIVRNIDGAERVGKRWRIPLRSMPPRYHVEAGLIPQD